MIGHLHLLILSIIYLLSIIWQEMNILVSKFVYNYNNFHKMYS